jgi:benzylsuccinate CoA-transferase BbsF subunit
MPARGVYAGLHLLELGAGAAGPVASRYFAEQGATVVRVESSRRPDFLRLLPPAPGTLPPGVAPGPDAAPMFALLNAGKRSVSLNLQTPEGLALAWRLVEWADVVIENFAPGVMERLGIAPARMLERRPDLVVVSSCLFGQTGPERDYPGFGGQGSAIAGFNELTGWPDREAIGPYATITDSLSPRYVAVLVAAALLARRGTGRGQHIDVSQIEAGVYSLSEVIVRCSANGEVVRRAGNRDPSAAPHGVYPCAGEDAWIAISVGSDAEWEALVAALGGPAWAREPAFATATARAANADALDARLSDWTRGFGAYALAARLQQEGVAAGPVQNVPELLRDPQLAERRHFVRVEHPVLGSLFVERSGFRLSEDAGGFERPGPLLGEHTEEVLGGILGLSRAEIEELVARGIAA